ncbi:MAG: hypothetical protein FWD69_12820 [Polyangiaceae bacterium]|nr:hypothetical protein [Polyangiaceae bacterium]
MNFSRTAVRTFFVAAVTLFATGAWADPPRDNHPDNKRGSVPPPPPPGRGPVAPPGPMGPPGRGAIAPGPMAPPGRGIDERAARRAKEQAEARQRLATQWKGPPNDALRQELRTHADRIARLERIKVVADMEHDRVSSAKAAQLIDKENMRHDKWMRTYGPRGGR